jgi:hypothetical protein
MQTVTFFRQHGFTVYAATICGVWLCAMSLQMIADTWDETNALLLFRDLREQSDLPANLKLLWTQSVGGLYRPLPLSIAFLIDTAIEDYDKSWHCLRLTCMLLLLASLALALQTLRRLASVDRCRDGWFMLLFLGSGSVVISGAWFANLFDACAMFFIASGLYCLATGRLNSAFVCLATAFFCKEIAILIFPFLAALAWDKKIARKPAACLIGALLPAFLLYFWIRQTLVPLGSAQDVHGFELSQLVPTARNLAESLWWQHTRRAEWGLAGLLATLGFLVSLRSYKLALSAIALLAGCTLVYVGMLGYPEGGVIGYQVFQGRLYLLPFLLLLLIAGLAGRWWTWLVILLPVLLGGVSTYTASYQLQQTYAALYVLASEHRGQPVYVHYPEKPLADTRRQLFIGDYPEAEYRIEPQTGRVLCKRCSAIGP